MTNVLDENKTDDRSVFTLPMYAWTMNHTTKAMEQGWNLYKRDGIWTIKTVQYSLDDHRDDMAAMETVVNGARKGDNTCILALFLDGQLENEMLDVPKVLLTPSEPDPLNALAYGDTYTFMVEVTIPKPRQAPHLVADYLQSWYDGEKSPAGCFQVLQANFRTVNTIALVQFQRDLHDDIPIINTTRPAEIRNALTGQFEREIANAIAISKLANTKIKILSGPHMGDRIIGPASVMG